MIINSVKARNVLKYATLELGEIPEEGIIAISGENESGKSSIGETICFALFGRTFSLDQEHLGKVLRWGENRCSVILEFTIDGTRYQLGRFFDRDGNHGARLALADEPDKTLARGVTSVADRLYEILGYDFDEFVESFYLAQREITTPHPHSMAVKTMAGVAPLEHVAADLEEEIAKFEEMLEEIEAEAEALRQEQQELDFQEGLLVSLEDRKNELEAEVAANRERLTTLEEAGNTYRENHPLVRRAEGKRGRSRFWRFVTFVLALVAAGTWGLLSQAGDLPQSQQLLQLLQQTIPGWQDSWIPLIGWSAIGLAVLMVLSWTRVSYHDRRANELKAETAGLPRAMEAARAIRPMHEEIAEPPGEESLAGAEVLAEDSPEETLETIPEILGQDAERFPEADYARLLPRVESLEAAPSEVEMFIRSESGWLRAQIARKERLLAKLEQQVEQELERVRQMARLTEVIDGLEKKEDEIRAGQEKRRKAIELLMGASADFSNDFNKEIRELVARTLPIFTLGRYEHLRIDPDLTVRVFSSDKHDFMDLDEVSSGTQRQIMLALRLALSQKLLNRKVKGKQFAFLDEPFAFFDEERTRYALKALSGLSESLKQIWIVAQAYPEGVDVEFAKAIRCSRDLDTLEG